MLFRSNWAASPSQQLRRQYRRGARWRILRRSSPIISQRRAPPMKPPAARPRARGPCRFRPKFLGQIWGYPKYPRFFGVTPDLPQNSGVNLELPPKKIYSKKKSFFGAKKTLPQISGVYPKFLGLPQNYPRFLG